MKLRWDLLWQAMWLANLALSLSLIAHFMSPAKSLVPGDSQELATNQAHDLPDLSVQEAAKHLVAGDATFVDARTLEAFKSGHIPSAYSAPAGQELSSRGLQTLKKAPLIIVYCDGPTCRASEDLARDLVGKGFQRVALMRQGMEGWQEAGMPLAKVTPKLK